jgi:hypothetical protein
VILVHYIPIYWGLETKPTDRSAITKATLHEVLPPYRQSDWAFRIRVSPWHWLHVGRYHHDSAIGRYGLTDDLDVIREWRGPRAPIEEDDRTGADGQQV